MEPTATTATPATLCNPGRFIAENYDAVLLDQYGVVHDGDKAYPGANECLLRLCEATKVYMLSNSTKRQAGVLKGLESRALDGSRLAGIVTSGDIVHDAFSNETDFVREKYAGKRCYALENSDGEIHGWSPPLAGFCEDVRDADFILAMGVTHLCLPGGGSRELEGEFPSPELAEAMAEAGKRGLPMLCGNPDFASPPRADGTPGPVTPGSLARLYEQEHGGRVDYVGKPYPMVYDIALERLRREHGITDPSRVCMVGDSLHHDAQGAARAGIDCVWILGGINAAELGIPAGVHGTYPDPGRVDACVAANGGFRPRYMSPGFVW